LDLNTLKDAFITNEIDFSHVVEQMKTELLWNTLIFEIYKNRITINKDEIDDQLSKFQNQNKEKIEEYLISEIVIRSVEKDKIESEIKRLKDKISIEGFANVAMDVSISETSVSGGNLGWVSENSISEELKSKIAMTPIGNISEPIFLQEGILFFIIRDKRISKESSDLEEEKNKLVNTEKAKILRMHSLSHYDNVRRTISIRYY
jgi:peptidyl-prolyl cis-trans isomerase SurA